jgi:hypothetical protein
MPIIAKNTKGDFTPAPEGLHSAVCVDVVDLGIQQSQWGEAHKVQIRWQLEDLDPKTNKPYMVVSKYTLSLHEKSRLRPTLEAWRGRKFTAEEMEGFDLEKLVGANCQIQVIHNVKDGGEVYANVQAVVPAAKNAPKLRPNGDYIRVAERDKRAQLEANPNGITDEDVPF